MQQGILLIGRQAAALATDAGARALPTECLIRSDALAQRRWFFADRRATG